MAEFVKDFAAQTALRTTRLLADNGTANGTVTPADILGLLLLADMLPKLLLADYVPKVIAANVTAYTLVPDDKNKLLIFLCSGNCVVSVPAGQSANFEAGWLQWGAGILNWQSAAGAGQGITSTDGLRSVKKGSDGAIRQILPNEWHLSGYTQV